jgi:arylsulfatase A-like enzyme
MAADDAGRTRREVLPVPDVPRSGLVTYDAKDPDTAFGPIEELRPPRGAPNVLVVLIDDAGFGASSAFGGPCATPNAERLAAGGLKFNRFHTTALCSPTRAALLSGRNHHTVGMGGITEIATSAPGYTSMRPNTCAPLAEILRLNGYSTAQFGKCHEVPVWQTSPMGPFDNWPTGSGFEYFYGFIGGEAHQYYPALYEGTTPVEPDRTPEEGYHLMGDMTDKAITWIRQQKSLMADKPFFAYFAPGATHAPHHVPSAWADRYAGQFDEGWDALRERTFARQKQLGVIPAGAELTPRHAQVPAWSDMPEQLKPVLRRQMEIYAGFLEFTDHHVGRLFDALEELEVFDDTLIYYIVGDNGASAEGTLNGTFNEMINFNGAAALETPEFMIERLDQFGGPDSYNHYAVGWAHAMDTPYQWTKQVASHFGGTRNGTVVHWPAGFAPRGEIRTQFAHVIDVAPTILDAAGLVEPKFVHGVQQTPMQGVSMRYAFADAAAAERHETQYHKGWTAVTRHKTPWILVGEQAPAFDDDIWELYDTSVDWTQFDDLAAKHPDKLHELQRLFLIEAARNDVLPLDDRVAERILPAVAGRPQLVTGSRQRLFAGMGRLSESSIVSIKNTSHAVTAEIVVPDEGVLQGVIIAQGGSIGGWSLYVKDGTLRYCYNLLGVRRFHVAGDRALPPGRHQVRMEFDYAGPGLGKGGTVTLLLDGEPIGEGTVAATAAMIFSADDTCDVGREDGALVADDYPVPNAFTGEIEWVEIDVGDAAVDADHVLAPDELLRVAMARQ